MCLIKWMAPHTPLPSGGGRPRPTRCHVWRHLSSRPPEGAIETTTPPIVRRVESPWQLVSFIRAQLSLWRVGEESGAWQVLVLPREILIFPPTDNPRGHLVVSDLPRCFQGQPHTTWRLERDPTSILINIILGLVSKQESQVSKTGKTITKGFVLSFSHPFL